MDEARSVRDEVAQLRLVRALADLDFSRVAAAVVARCRGPRGQDPTLALAGSHEAMSTALGESREALTLLDGGEPLPLDAIPDVREALARLSRGGVLDAPSLRDVMALIAAARTLRRFLGTRRARVPLLLAACSTDPTLDTLEEELASAIDPDGTVGDRASPDVARLRTEVTHVRARVVSRLDELVVKHADVLSDRFHTLRDGRYVLPVRTDAHERVPGIVHGTSASGATVFVEPRGLVPLGNRLRIAQSELEREIDRVLAVLSDLARERSASLDAAADALDHADLRAASARLCRDLSGRFPDVADGARIRLVAARHPVLALDGAPVVANDIELRAGQALVISGPNAGGKTVSMKTLGLAALMARAGLPVLAKEGSEVGFFAEVLTDVGDEQSIEKSLSTFSAHVTNVAAILEVANDRSLVLLDEIAGGTDPDEGAALACAVVDALCRRGAASCVTTHYEPLKALAVRDARLRNASVGFDVAAMRPTYELRLDVPGASSALAVAARFGIPHDVLELARRMLPEQVRSAGEVLAKLDAEWRALAVARAGAEDELRRATVAREEAERILRERAATDKARISREAEALVAALRRARDDVRDAQRRLRDADAAAVEQARRTIDEAATHVAVGSGVEETSPAPPPAETAITADDLRPGVRVHVPKLRSDAEVIELPTRGRVRVAAGAMKLWVDVDEVRALPASSPVRAGAKLGAPESAPRALTPPPPTEDTTVDVRGMRVDDALDMIESFLDRLYGASQTAAWILHGHGTGALRDAIRKKLAEPSSYVRVVRPATTEEGGDRYTVVLLK